MMDDQEYHPNSDAQTVASITPSSRLALRPAVSAAAKARVQAVDPNNGRCLIENCDRRRAVEYAHCVPRHLSQDEKKMTSLEYWWNMEFQTLNLDTRYNIFPVNSSLHYMFDKPDASPSWTLLPEDDVIMAFWNTLTRRREDDMESYYADRATFPTFPDSQVFRYRLLILPDSQLNRSALIHQHTIPDERDPAPSSDQFHIYKFPFDDYPRVQSHLQPHFVILEAGRKLALKPGAIPSFTRKYPIMTKVLELYGAWTAEVPEGSLNNEDFNPQNPPSPKDDRDDDDDSKTADGRYNPRKRQNESPLSRVQKRYIRGRGKETQEGEGDVARDGMESYSDDMAVSFSGETLRDHDARVGKVQMSTRISEWIKGSLHVGL